MSKFSPSRLPSFPIIFLSIIFSFVGTVNLYGQDYDGDGIVDASDNCPATPNANQIDKNGNGVGDACENPSASDGDNDGWPNNLDNCPSDDNESQSDFNGDGTGDLCNECSSSPVICFNGGEIYVETAIFGPVICGCICPCGFMGDRCATADPGGCPPSSTDTDGDGVANSSDNAPYISNAAQTDTDSDGKGDATDNCMFTSNASQTDTDGDGIGDVCEGLVLPVSLLSYKAEIVDQKIYLSWVTGTELNNHHFILDKSTNGSSFSEWKQVAAAGGNRNEPTTYEVWDEQVENLVFHYYRLRQVDIDGSMQIIGIAEIDTRSLDEVLPEVRLFPNPTQSATPTYIEITDPHATNTSSYVLSLLDLQGREISRHILESKKSLKSNYLWEDLPQLNSGLYFLMIRSGRWVRKVSFLIE